MTIEERKSLLHLSKYLLMNKYDYFGDLEFETELYKLLEE